jgi:hypothetical protein
MNFKPGLLAGLSFCARGKVLALDERRKGVPMNAGKPLKKSEVLEVRLPHETKTAFMARCRETRRTASQAVRSFIDQELEGRTSKPRRRGLIWRVVAAAFAGLAVGAVAAPSLARPITAHAAFDRLDANHDGSLSYDEFSRR